MRLTGAAEQPRRRPKPVSEQQIRTLREAAVASGDRFFVRVCDRALTGEPDAIDACRMALYGISVGDGCEMSGREATTEVVVMNSGPRTTCPGCGMNISVTRDGRYGRHRP